MVQIREHAQDNALMYLAATVTAVMTLAGAGYTALSTFDQLATDADVSQAIEARVVSVEAAIERNSAAINEILQNQKRMELEAEIATYMRYRCKTGGHELIEQLDRALREYRRLTGRDYHARECDFYLSQ